jgi:hypothetical protein
MSTLGVTSGPRTDRVIQWLLDGDSAIRWQELPVERLCRRRERLPRTREEQEKAKSKAPRSNIVRDDAREQSSVGLSHRATLRTHPHARVDPLVTHRLTIHRGTFGTYGRWEHFWGHRL